LVRLVLEKYRNKGFGKEILLETIKRAVSKGFKIFRLYSSKKYCKEALKLYEKVMDFGEDYTLEELDMERVVYTKSLTDKTASKWNNRNLFLYLETEKESKGYKAYLNLIKNKKA